MSFLWPLGLIVVVLETISVLVNSMDIAIVVALISCSPLFVWVGHISGRLVRRYLSEHLEE